MKRFILIFILIFSFNFLAFTKDSEAELRFQNAIALYQKKDYVASSEEFIKLISNGYYSEELLFNLANCYANLEDIPKAVLYYERALKQSPFNEEIKHNLRLAKYKIGVEIIDTPTFFLLNYWNNFSCIIRSNSWAYMSAAFFISFIYFCYRWLFGKERKSKKRSFFLALAFVILGILSLMASRTKYQLEFGHKTAIVMSQKLYLKSGPNIQSKDQRLLFGGVKVHLIDQIGEWYKVILANNEIGWIEMKDLEII